MSGRVMLHNGAAGPTSTCCIADIDLSPTAHTLSRGGRTVPVEPKVMQVLMVLAQAGGQVVSRDAILDAAWEDHDISDEALTRAISQLRKAFATLDPLGRFVETVPKSGYRLAHSVDWVATEFPTLGPRHMALTPSKEAYQLYLQGRALNTRINGRTEIPVARDLLSEAIKLDPDFAEAHAELAQSCTLIGTYISDGATLETFEATEYHAQRALELKPDLALGMIMLAIAKFTRGNVVEAIRLNERAMQLEPMNSEVVMRLGYFYAGIGLVRKAIPILERAVELDPTQGRNIQVLALAKFANGDLDAAEKFAKRAIDLHHYFAHDTYAGIAFARGDHALCEQRMLAGFQAMEWMFDDAYDDAAIRMTAKLVSSPDRSQRLSLSAMLLAQLGDLEKTPELPLYQGVLRCGDAKAFFDLSARHLPIGRHGSFLSLWPDIGPCRDIHNHPDFATFADKAGFSAAWEEFGRPDCLAKPIESSKHG